MNGNQELEDEAEQAFGRATVEESEKFAKRILRFVGLVIATYLGTELLGWLFVIPTSVKNIEIGIFAVVGAFIVADYISLVGKRKDLLLSEVRARSKQINQRLTEIESTIESNTKRISKQLSRFETRLAASSDGTGGTVDIDSEEPDEDVQHDAEARAELVAKYVKSAERGESWGQHNLGITYYNGTRGARDFVQAAFWFRKAGEQGEEFSQYLAAESICASGADVPPDYAEALSWYRKVSDGNNLWSKFAEHSIGKMYAEGKGVPIDCAEASRWWQKAADRGYNMAHYQLGCLYAEGAEGVPRDRALAYYRLYLAVAGEGLGSLQKRAVEKRNEVANQLKPDAVSRARERAEQWLATHAATV